MSVPSTVVQEAYRANLDRPSEATARVAAEVMDSSGFTTKRRSVVLVQLSQTQAAPAYVTSSNYRNLVLPLLDLRGNKVTLSAADIMQVNVVGSGALGSTLISSLSSSSLGSLSLWHVDELNKQNSKALINEIERATTNTPWGSLKKRLTTLLDGATPEEGYAPLQPGSLSTLLELIKKAPTAKRPSITVTTAGRLWLEWNLGERQRFALEMLGGARLRFAWVKPDDLNEQVFASRSGKATVTDFLSEEGNHATFWRRILVTNAR